MDSKNINLKGDYKITLLTLNFTFMKQDEEKSVALKKALETDVLNAEELNGVEGGREKNLLEEMNVAADCSTHVHNDIAGCGCNNSK